MICPKCNREAAAIESLYPDKPNAIGETYVRVDIVKCPFCNTEYTVYIHESDGE